MDKPTLVIMAAGMGSRYGGQKQIDPVDEYGHIIMDFSIYDAKEAGFENVIFIIKKEHEADFRRAAGDRIARYMDVAYVFQELDALPDGFSVPAGRVKPWGTGHAVLSCIDRIHGPFAVINADDYYGKEAFRAIYRFLSSHRDDSVFHYAMVGYRLMNTLTENGYVSRGVCTVDERSRLMRIDERTHIEKRGVGAVYIEDDGTTERELPVDALVSMNLWGFSESILKELQAGFPAFLREGLRTNPLKCEYFLPSVVSNLLTSGRADVSVLKTDDRWFGITYKEDKPVVTEAIRRLRQQGAYPEYLWPEEDGRGTSGKGE